MLDYKLSVMLKIIPYMVKIRKTFAWYVSSLYLDRLSDHGCLSRRVKIRSCNHPAYPEFENCTVPSWEILDPPLSGQKWTIGCSPEDFHILSLTPFFVAKKKTKSTFKWKFYKILYAIFLLGNNNYQNSLAILISI